MSIAVSAIVRPSRCFALIAASMGVILFSTAWMLVQEHGAILHHGLAIVCVLAGICVSLFPLSRRKHLRVDISGIGQLRLVDTNPDAVAGPIATSTRDGEVVQLLRGSTFWSLLLVLRLQTRSGRTTTLLIFPDSVDSEIFHALSVACLWVAAKSSSPAAPLADDSLQAD